MQRLKHLTISLPEELVKQLKNFCWKEGYTASGLIRKLVEKQLKNETENRR